MEVCRSAVGWCGGCSGDKKLTMMWDRGQCPRMRAMDELYRNAAACTDPAIPHHPNSTRFRPHLHPVWIQ